MKITEALAAEHIIFHGLFDQIEVTLPNIQTLGEVKSISVLVESVLKAHSRMEDDLFLGPLEHCFEQIGQRDRFIQDHHELDGNLQRVQEASRLDAAKKQLLVAVAHSRKHFDMEERIVFPMAERVFKAETLEALGQAWTAQRQNTTPSQPGPSTQRAF